MSDTEDLLAQLRFAAEVEREAYKQEGATYINPMATICGRAATTIEEAMKMLIERDDRIAQLEAAARWIPVEEGFPEGGVTVLAFNTYYETAPVGPARYCHDREWWWDLECVDRDGDWDTTPGVTHWMKLPQPPSKEPA